MSLKAEVKVRLKPTINDPQGQAVLKALHALGFGEVTSVRVGKYLELGIDGDNPESAAARVEQLCRRLLTNHVLEESSFEIGSDHDLD